MFEKLKKNLGEGLSETSVQEQRKKRSTAETHYKKYGRDYYEKIGAEGGKKKNPKKGWGSKTPEERREAGRKGGLKSRRTKSEKANS